MKDTDFVLLFVTFHRNKYINWSERKILIGNYYDINILIIVEI